MNLNVENTQTSLNISDDVIKVIANEAIKEFPGCELAGLPVKIGMLPSSSKPVRITLFPDAAQIDIGILVGMNCRIKDTAERLQAVIKRSVQDMTEIAVSKVNVCVVGMKTDEP